MSWAQWQGEVWETTKEEARLRVHLWPPQAGCPRVSWSLSLSHHVIAEPEPGKREMQRWFNFDLGDLGFHDPDWRRLGDREIKGDAAWHAAQEHTGEYGRLDVGELTFRPVDLRGPREERPVKDDRIWYGHAFIVRLGAREGLTFPCEIDAWLIHESEYHRTGPETEAELAFPEEPPNLRIIASAVFDGGTICVPRCGADPLPLARKYLREETGWEELHQPVIDWTSRRTIDNKGSEPMPGWASTVSFRTRPKAEVG